MTTDQSGYKLRFRAGGFEQQVIYLIMLLQATLVVLLVFLSMWWVHFTISAWFSPRGSITDTLVAVPFLVGIAVMIALFNYLYE
ncbi:hypothetical protein [Natronorubrum halophilum]|uniref:hypothetical protein n=1 Tax=Natronorubrum halophilum TaxID=1702106 RepID=UPI000EF6778A|nr:hypothetical protein [Natronorubrum halophilum]